MGREVETVQSGDLAAVWQIMETVEQARGRAPVMSRPRKSNAECPATGRKILEVSILNYVKPIIHKQFQWIFISNLFHVRARLHPMKVHFRSVFVEQSG